MLLSAAMTIPYIKIVGDCHAALALFEFPTQSADAAHPEYCLLGFRVNLPPGPLSRGCKSMKYFDMQILVSDDAMG